MGGVIGDDRGRAGFDGFDDHRLGQVDREVDRARELALGQAHVQADAVPLLGAGKRRDRFHRGGQVGHGGHVLVTCGHHGRV